jgi:hypothetical protein
MRIKDYIIIFLYYILYYIIYLVRFEVFTAVTKKNAVFWDYTPCGFCKKREVSKERSASIIRLIRIGELGTTSAVTSNRRKVRSNSQRFGGT